MATMWEDADVDGLVRLAQLRDEFHRGDLPTGALGAVQALEDRYGLNPRSRRMLQWEITRGEVADISSARPKARKLRAVEGPNAG